MSSSFDPFHVNLLVRIRPCRRTDLAHLEWSRALADDRWLIERTFEEQQRDEALMLLADVNGVPAGQIWLDLTDPDRSTAVMWALRIIAPLRGHGIGTRLVLAAEEAMLERGFTCAEITVDRDNAGGLRLYERLGFSRVRPESVRERARLAAGSPWRVGPDQILLRKPLRSRRERLATGTRRSTRGHNAGSVGATVQGESP